MKVQSIIRDLSGLGERRLARHISKITAGGSAGETRVTRKVVRPIRRGFLSMMNKLPKLSDEELDLVNADEVIDEIAHNVREICDRLGIDPSLVGEELSRM